MIMLTIQDVEKVFSPFTPIEQLPEGLTVLLHVGDRYFYGYRLGKQFHRRGLNLDTPYTGILSPYEFRRLTTYEIERLGQKKAHRAGTRQAV